MVNAQNWLDENEKYKNKTDVKTIVLKNDPLEGKLEIKDFSSLERIYLFKTQGITELSIINCPNVWEVEVTDNEITEIKGLDELLKLRALRISGNPISDPNIVRNLPVTEVSCARISTKDGSINLTVEQRLNFFSGGLVGEQKISFSAKEDYKNKLLETANKLGIEGKELENKDNNKIKEAIDNKAEELKKEDELSKGNLEKIKKEFPDLIKEGQVDEDKLKEIKEGRDKGNEFVKDLEKLGIKSVEDVKKLQQDIKNMKEIMERLIGNAAEELNNQIEVIKLE